MDILKSLSAIFGTVLFAVIFAILIVVGINAFFAFIFQNLWNYVIPIFWSNAPILSFWQSFAIIFMCSIIGSFFKK